jgi:hypothetical protein
MPVHLFHQPAAVTFAVTATAVALSVAVTQATMWWVGHDADHLPAVLAGAIPAVMVPFAVYPLANANRRLRRVQAELDWTGLAARGNEKKRAAGLPTGGSDIVWGRRSDQTVEVRKDVGPYSTRVAAGIRASTETPSPRSSTVT